jgi:hypothetical protein
MNFSKLLMPIGVAIAAGTGVYLGTAPTTQACMVDSGGGECEHHYCAETCGEGGCGCFRDTVSPVGAGCPSRDYLRCYCPADCHNVCCY